MNQIKAPSRALKPRPFDPLLKAGNATPEQRASILRDYYDRKITFSLPKKTLTLTFGDEVNVIDLKRLYEPEHFVSLAVALAYKSYLSRRDIREILKRVAEIKNLRLFFFFCDKDGNFKGNKKPQAVKLAVL
jgi:hypothetical protein